MVKVKPTESQGRITVKTSNDTNVFSVKDNLSEYYAKLSEKWASSPEIVNGIDYSSKYYAEQSKASAQVASDVKTETQELVEGFDNKVQIAKDDIEQNRINSINAIENTYSIAVEDMQEKSDGVLTNIETSKAEAIERLKQSSTALTQSQITNCLLEVPQNIKLELNNGTLTLKAGSKVIVPNGFEADGITKRFDEVVIKSDVSLLYEITGTHTRLLCYRQDTNGFDCLAGHISGNTLTVTSGSVLWYDTANNLVKFCKDGVVLSERKESFPIAVVTAGNGFMVNSIDQVFNGMGYIGSTFWVDKGVKGLVPTGRNEDGSLRNFEYTTNTVAISDRSVLDGENRAFLLNYKKNVLEDKAYSEDNKTVAGTGQYLYNPITNNIYNSGGTKGLWVLCGYYSSTDGKITSFQPYKPFRAVDYNDFDTKANKEDIYTKTESDSRYINATGDTMTGGLHINNTTPFVSLINNAYDKASTGTLSANKTLGFFRVRDKNNVDVFTLSNTYMTNGNVQSFWNIARTVGGVNKVATIGIGVTQDGTAFTAAPTPSTGDNSTKIATTAYCVNRRCTAKATTTSSASVTRPCWIVQNYVNGTSWYRVWSDGWIEQGGLVQFADDAEHTVNYLKAFSNNNYTLTVGVITTYANSAQHKNLGARTKTATGFTVWANSTYMTTGKSWYACGY